MAEKIKMHKIAEEFIHNKCSFTKKNKSYKINFHFYPNNSNNNNNRENLLILYDNLNYIPCLIKKKEELLSKKKDLELIIKDWLIELVIYKNENDLNKIKCGLILIVNNYSIVNNKEDITNNKIEEGEIKDINNEEKIIDKLNVFLFDYIKENKDKKDINKILFLTENTKNNIRFFNKEIKDFPEDEIKKIKNLKNVIEINCNTNKSLNEILDEINPSYKEQLMGKYMDEMPEEIVDLMKKYKNVNFNNEMYLNYLKYKNNNVENNEVKKEENKNICTPIEEENNNENNNDNKIESASDKKQLFQIK